MGFRVVEVWVGGGGLVFNVVDKRNLLLLVWLWNVWGAL
jgi:hypothetical protein